jgi:hypothetical protein
MGLSALFRDLGKVLVCGSHSLAGAGMNSHTLKNHHLPFLAWVVCRQGL